jgi:hypothetical protein
LVHAGGVPAGVDLSAQAGFNMSVHVGLEPSEQFAGPFAGSTVPAPEAVETNKQITAMEDFII